MVHRSTVYKDFVQNGNTCTLASYAVGAYHFTGIKPYDYFMGYCQYFSIPAATGEQAEQEYDRDFHQRYDREKRSGYKIIQELHDSCEQESFAKSRDSFQVGYIHNTAARLEEIERRLREDEALLSVAFRVNRSGHSSCVGCDQEGFYMVETSPSATNRGVVPISAVSSLAPLRDSLLMCAHVSGNK